LNFHQQKGPTMPIRPENRKLYPANWKQIRANVLYRAHDRCEGSPAYPYCDAENGVPHPGTGSKVVLTIAHLDHNPTNNEPSNLRAWCQLCHNTYDAKQRAANSKARKAVLKPGNFNLTRKAAAVTPEAAGALEAAVA
jgi:5-methylcytosine-specific restriction endonuclease McrA